MGRFLGFSFGADGTFCLNIGGAVAAPAEVTLEENPLW
jgi:hypothetical protein